MARWYATSTQMLDDPKVVKVGEHYGGDTISVIHGLLRQAMLQENGGEAEVTFRNLAHDTFTAADKAREIVVALADTGFLTVESDDEYSVIVCFPAWSRHQANFRKAKSRASKATDEADVTPSHDQSRPVTKSHLQDRTGEERTRQEKREKKPSGKPSEFESWLTHYRTTTGKVSVTGSKPARNAFKARRDEGRTLDDLKAATVGCHGDDFCRTNGHDVPETILRASKVERYIALAQQPRSTGSAGMDNARRRAEEIKARQKARQTA